MLFLYCDESGKFRDHSVVSFGAIAGEFEFITGKFGPAWKYYLRENGLAHLTMKEALNVRKELSAKNPALGDEARIGALLPFVDVLKKNLGLLTGMAIEVKAFQSMSQAAQKQLGRNPQYAAFTRIVQEALKEEFSEDENLGIVCDDDEEVAVGIYKLYRKLKLAYPVMRKRVVSLSLADDEEFYALQGADMVASLIRLEARRQFLNETYAFQPLYNRLTSKLETGPQAAVTIGMFDAPRLKSLSEMFVEFEKEFGRYGAPPLVED